MIYKLIHCLRHSSKTQLGILPEKKERETVARDTLSVFAGTICGQGPDYDRPRNLEIRKHRKVGETTVLLTILCMNQPAESTNTGLVMPCSRRCRYKISRLLKIPDISALS